MMELIGDTPLVEVPQSVHGLENVQIFAKLELMNPFGSIKDRIARELLEDDFALLHEQRRTVIENSSGNTAKAMQALCSVHDVGFRTVTNRIKLTDQRDLLLLLGADVHELPGTSDCHDPTDPNDPLICIEREVAASNGQLHHTSQYTNPANLQAHHRTGDEIVKDLGHIDMFVGGLGTTGSTRGVAERLIACNPEVAIHGVVASSGDHIPGIRTADELFEVGLFDRSLYASIIEMSSLSAIDGMVLLARGVGIMAGPTAGATFMALIEHLRPLPRSTGDPLRAVFLACDRIEPYMQYIRDRRPDLVGRSAKPDGFAAHVTQPSELETALISIEDLQDRMHVGACTVIDTRGALAYRTAHIPGAMNVTDEFVERMLDMGTLVDETASVVFVCPVGRKSARYATYLRRKGIEAYSLAGGITAWRDGGRPMHVAAKQS